MKCAFKSFNFGIITHRDAEVLLNTMASKGYEFKGLGKGYLQGVALFERNEKAKDLTYAVDVRYGLGEVEVRELCAFYRDMGWEHKDTHRKKLYIFVSKDENPAPLYTDEYSKYQVVSEAMRQDGSPYGAIVLAILFGLVARLLMTIPDIFDSSLLAYSLLVCFLLTAVASLILAGDAFVYRVRYQRRMEQGKSIPDYPVQRELQKWNAGLGSIFFCIGPVLQICGSVYLIWGRAANLTGDTERILLILLIFWSVLVLPLLLWSAYKGCVFPEKKYWNKVSCVWGFLYYVTLYTFLNLWMRQLL